MPGVGELMLASFAPSAIVDPQNWFVNFLLFNFVSLSFVLLSFVYCFCNTP